MRKIIIREEDTGYIKIFKDELKNLEDFEAYKKLPNASLDMEGTEFEHIVFYTFNATRAKIQKGEKNE